MSEPIDARQLTRADVDALADAQASVPHDAIVVRPDKDNGGIEAMEEVLEALHAVDTGGGGLLRRETNTTPAHAFEIRYATAPGPGDQRELTLQYVAGSEETDGQLERQLQTRYPGSITDRRDPVYLAPEPGQYAAAATLSLRRYCLYPIKNISLDGFRSDPTGSIMTEMVGAAEDTMGGDADVAVQVMFRPYPRDWLSGVSNGQGVDCDIEGAPGVADLCYRLRQPWIEHHSLIDWPLIRHLWVEEVKHPPTKKEKDVAAMLEQQDGKAWELCLRIVAIADDPAVATGRAEATAKMFGNFYEYRGEQTFLPDPCAPGDVPAFLTTAAGREWPDGGTGLVKTQREVAGLVNVPEADDVSTSKFRWSLSKPGEGVPPGTPRFDYDAAGLSAREATRADLQAAMLEVAGDDEPLWYGTGARHGTEAGVFQEKLFHQFVGGQTRMGKTTFLTNFVGQSVRGSGGGLVMDPKGKDGEEFLAEWPTDRSDEDLVDIDLTGEYDEVPRFNFLEIPDYLEPGTRAHTSYCEALAEDILAMVAEAGGTDNYVGALMKRVVKTVVRGLAKRGETATLLDVAVVCADAGKLERFKRIMDDERFGFLRDAAERLAEHSEQDLEPLAGRMDEWVLNDNVRELICARESSFSINEAVEAGRWLMVTFAPDASETEVQMVGTALIRRTYFAQRHLQPEHTFDLVCDEADKVLTEHSNVHLILSEAAAFNYRCTFACQAPTNQLPERVRAAIENQCGTFISFNPGGGDDARWIANQHTLEDADVTESLLNLPRFKFYMRATTRDDALTHSYMVEGFPPAREVRDDARTDADIAALKERSHDLYGAPVETEAEQRAASPYIDDGSGTGETSETSDSSTTPEPSTPTPDAVRKAVFDAALRAGDEEAPVPVDTVRDLLVERGHTLDHDAPLWDAVDRDPEIIATEDDELRVTGDGIAAILATGSAASAGVRKHREILKDAYRALTRLGGDVDLPEQAGREDVDGICTLDGTDLTLEAESTTSTKPAQTLRNLRKAMESGRDCLLLARPEDAARVYEALTDPPLVRSQTAARTRFYNGPTLRIDGEELCRPAGGSETRWYREHATGNVVCEDSDGQELARFADAKSVFRDRSAYPDVEGDPAEDPGVEYIKAPSLPSLLFGGSPPTEGDWQLVVVPPGAAEPTALYRAWDGALYTVTDAQALCGEAMDDAPAGPVADAEAVAGDDTEPSMDVPEQPAGGGWDDHLDAL